MTHPLLQASPDLRGAPVQTVYAKILGWGRTITMHYDNLGAAGMGRGQL